MENEYLIRARSPAGEAKHKLLPPFTSDEAQSFIVQVEESILKRTANTDSVKKFGEKLFDAVLNKDIRAIYKSSLDQATAKGDGLRLRIHLHEAVELYHLPWEYLYQSVTNQFVGLDRQTPIVRYLDMPRAIPPLKINPPLRILIIISSPTELVYLDVENEKRKIQRALKSLKNRNLVEISWLEVATVTELRKVLRRTEYHVLHFIGHGDFDAIAGQGWLAFEDENESVDRVSAEQVGAMLNNHPSLRLIALNSCLGARSSSINPFAGTATTLMQHGVPAIVAMQFKISDAAAIKFAEEFYSAIADGLPVDAAVTEARVAVFSNEDQTIEWGTPVLFMRSLDGHLFDIQTKAVHSGDSPAHSKKFEPQINSAASDAKASPIKSKILRQPTLILLAAVTLIFGMICFFILSVLPKNSAVEMEVYAQQMNFSLPPEVRSGDEVSLLYSGVWAQSVGIEKFEPFKLRIQATLLSENANTLTIFPHPQEGRINLLSPLSGIFIQDVICDSGSAINIKRDGEVFVLRIRNSNRSPYQILSLDKEVLLSIHGCKVIDELQHDLTQLFKDPVKVRLHDMSRSLHIQGKDGELLADFQKLDANNPDTTNFMLEQLVENLDFTTDVYQMSGRIIRSTINSISVKKSFLTDKLNFKSLERGDIDLTFDPNRFIIYDLHEYQNTLKVRAQGRLKSLQVGQGVVKDELIPRYLSFIAQHPQTSIAITVIGWLLTVLVPLILKIKYKVDEST